ncbi:hypothetical protein SCLCIDRAFT_1033532 [Scleroderma citrinum Foug A]|uniref:Uncharacterized protein n=1 Tax=Scleroderma citrinum Foug A TaxID=1036808 RepID=A0A0C3DES2_9AGAM|nr:hypothetical protein SCLCIDRAFT_1033532 [Scleroderma citrinum Foug A]
MVHCRPLSCVSSPGFFFIITARHRPSTFPVCLLSSHISSHPLFPPLAHHRYRAVARISFLFIQSRPIYVHASFQFTFAYSFPNATLHSFGTPGFHYLIYLHHVFALPTFPGGAWSFFGILERFMGWHILPYKGMEETTTTRMEGNHSVPLAVLRIVDLDHLFICIFR